MSRFRFKLERLAKVRRIQEEQDRELWMQAETVRRDAEAQEAQALERVRAVEAELRARQSDDSLGVADVLQGQEALVRAREALLKARERTKTATYQADRLRAPWEERRKEVRGLDRLKEQDHATWRREELQREAREMDEVASQRLQAQGPNRGTPEASPGSETRPKTLRAAAAGADPQGPPSGGRSTETSLPEAS